MVKRKTESLVFEAGQFIGGAWRGARMVNREEGKGISCCSDAGVV